MRISIGADHGGRRLKDQVKEMLMQMDIDVDDVGSHDDQSVDYPDYAKVVAHKVKDGRSDLGILVCGTGIGMSIAANKVAGIRCAVVSDEFSARMSREHNQANMLALGERVVGPDLAKSIVKAWLSAEFAGDRHARRVKKIAQLESTSQE